MSMLILTYFWYKDSKRIDEFDVIKLFNKGIFFGGVNFGFSVEKNDYFVLVI